MDRRASDCNQRSPRGRRTIRILVLVATALSLVGVVRLVISFRDGVARGDISAELGGALVALPVFVVFLLALAFLFLRAGRRRSAILAEQFPGGMQLDRCLYAANTEAALNRLGSDPSVRPGLEYISVAIGPRGVALMQSRERVALLPRDWITCVAVEECEMSAGRARECLIFHILQDGEYFMVPFLVISQKGLWPRALGASELRSLAAEVCVQLGIEPDEIGRNL